MKAKDYFEIIDGKFPIRKTRQQKESFLKYAQAAMGKMGYTPKIEENKGLLLHKNLVAGEPLRAQVVFTAHYDTPAANLWPDLQTPGNPVFSLFYQLLIVGLLMAVSFGVMLGAQLLFGNARLSLGLVPATFAGLIMLLLWGPANKHNRNDNTSGLAVLLALMESIPQEKRKQVAFVLTDHSSQGQLGARAYAKAHPQVQYTPLVIDLNCLGQGESLVGIATRLARSHPAYETLAQALMQNEALPAFWLKGWGSAYTSDHSAFKCSVGLMACQKAPALGWYVGRIHTGRDTKADTKLMQNTADALTSFIKEL
ncbi:MAG: M28 family peptidase [Clostridia bacterium]|nr:M28 family peptidase [Clostridia bacterium]